MLNSFCLPKRIYILICDLFDNCNIKSLEHSFQSITSNICRHNALVFLFYRTHRYTYDRFKSWLYKVNYSLGYSFLFDSYIFDIAQNFETYLNYCTGVNSKLVNAALLENVFRVHNRFLFKTI